MKKIFTAAVGLCLAMAANSFAITKADTTTILGEKYYKVSKCSDLKDVRTWTANGTIANYVLTQDIKCDNAEFKPIGQAEDKAFEGIFDGNGKTISGLNIVQNAQYVPYACNFWGCQGGGNQDSYAGLFGIIGKKGVVKNLTISDSKVTATSQYAGAVVGLNYGVVENAKTTNSVQVNSTNDPESQGGVGGIAGRNGGYGTMLHCENNASVVGQNLVGGIAGANTGAISTSINYGSVSGAIAGGIVGGSHYRNVESDITHVPGRIAVCLNEGAVTGTTYAGGIVGENKDGTVNNCRNDGSVTGGIAGGVVGYNRFDNYDKYQSGNYTAVVLNSFSTTEHVTGSAVGGVVGLVENYGVEYVHNREKRVYPDPSFSTIENCYYDSEKLSNVKEAVNSSSNSTITTVVGKPTTDMNTNDNFVEVLNTQNHTISYSFVWLFENGNYPVLDFSGSAGDYKITFVVKGEVVLEARTTDGYIVEVTVNDPSVPGSVFRGWKDDHGNVMTSDSAQKRLYTRAVTYNAVLNELFEITFVTSFGKELGKKLFEKGFPVFYYDEENETTTPADFETETTTYKFTGVWSPEFADAVENTTYTAQYEEIAKGFPVRFYVQGDLVDSQFVAVNAAAVAPADPVREGFRFDGWSEDFSKITAALDIDAKMVKTYNFCYFNLEDDLCETVDDGTEVAIPEIPGNDSTVCSAWMENNEVVEGTVIVVDHDVYLTPKCALRNFEVKFLVKDEIIDNQTVTYGQAAVEPELPEDSLFSIRDTVYKFNNWNEDFSSVTADLDVTAAVTRQVKVCFGEDCEYVDEGSEVTVPENSDPEGKECHWENAGIAFNPGDVFTATEDMQFEEPCADMTFEVKFLVKDEVINNQTVTYGQAAVEPELPEDSLFSIRDTLYKFNNWIEDFSEVTDNLDVNAKMTRQIVFCFVVEGDTVKCDTSDVGSTTTIEENPTVTGKTCLWAFGETLLNIGDEIVREDNMTFVDSCVPNEYNVRFLALDSVLNEQTVIHGAAAEDPEVAEGSMFVIRDTVYKFNNWIEDFSEVTDNLDVNAKMTRQIVFCFVVEGDTVKCDTSDVGSTTTIEENPTVTGKTCLWAFGETLLNIGDEIVREDNMTFVDSCVPNEYNVRFVAFDSVLVDEQTVLHGQAAEEPESSKIPVFEGYRFNDWDADFTYVESDMVINAMFDTLQKVSIHVETQIGTIDTTFMVVKDTTITGLKTLIDQLSGEYFVCEDVTINGAELKDTIVVTEDVDVNAVCTLVTHTVTYYVDGELVRTEVVTHGSDAKRTEGPEVKGKFFVKWDKDLHKVVADIKTNGIYSDVEYDTIRVVVNGKTIDSILVAKGDSVNYVLPKVKDTKDSTFTGWKFGKDRYDAKDTVVVKYGDKSIVADFDAKTALRGVRSVASFSIHSENGQLQVIGARIGAELTVLDLQGRVIVRKPVQNSVELISVANRGSYLVRVGSQAKRVTVR